jgi:hypothetical protein
MEWPTRGSSCSPAGRSSAWGGGGGGAAVMNKRVDYNWVRVVELIKACESHDGSGR